VSPGGSIRFPWRRDPAYRFVVSITDILDKVADAAVVPGYTRIGPALRRHDWEQLPSMAGTTAVITGATSGIGEAAARRMAGLGAHVVVIGRDPEKASRIRDGIAADAGREDAASVEVADLSLMAEIRDLAGRLLEAHPTIDVLVNNVGVLYRERRETAEGIDRSLATNLLGHFLLTNLLMPRLEASAPARIVNVTSGGMYTVRISISNLQNDRGEYDGRAAYARAKRGQVILTEMWAEEMRDRGVVVHAMHPGWVDTPGVDSGIPLFGKVMGPLLRTPEQGADTIVWLSAAEEPAETTGLFWHDRRPRPTHRVSRTRETPEQRTALWRALADLSGWSGS